MTAAKHTMAMKMNSMRKQFLRPRYLDWLNFRSQGLIFLPQASLRQGQSLTDLFIQPEFLPHHRQVLRLQLGQQQGVVSQLCQLAGLAGDDVQILLLFLLGKARLLQQLSEAADRGQGRLKLVREGVDVLLPHGAHLLQLLYHAIKVRIGDAEDPCTLFWQAHAQISVNDGLKSLSELSEPPVRRPNGRKRGTNADQDREQQRCGIGRRAQAEFRKGLDSQAIQPCGNRSAYRQ